jgi:hypothetical protein
VVQNKASQNKTSPTGGDVAAFVGAVADPTRRAEAELLTELMAEVTGEPPAMWGTAIIGFGSVHYRYASGREGDSPRVSFAPRKTQSVVYVRGGFDSYDDLLPRMGNHSIGKGCLYLKRVENADQRRCARWSTAPTAGRRPSRCRSWSRTPPRDQDRVASVRARRTRSGRRWSRTVRCRWQPLPRRQVWLDRFQAAASSTGSCQIASDISPESVGALAV